jgi:predicted DCC family thiol-disulfide oxidoreductase YuxK
MLTPEIDSDTLYLIYDDECPLCRNSAHALNIKHAVGNLVLINAREAHPLIDATYERGFDLDQGIVVIYHQQYYFGADAVHFLAMLNSPIGFVNKIAATLFSNRLTATILYPIIKSIRRFFLALKHVGPVKRNTNLPLFAQVLGAGWQQLPAIMQRRFSNRPYTNDVVAAEGLMTITGSRWMSCIKPFLMLSGALVQQEGDNIPVSVIYKSEPNSAKYCFDRKFNFTPPLLFKSYMVNVKNNIMIEFMKFNIGWRTKCSVIGDSVMMSHDGYVFRFFNLFIPVPIVLLIGKCSVVERPISEDSFSMEMHLNHFIFGKIYEYRGIFKIVDNISYHTKTE